MALSDEETPHGGFLEETEPPVPNRVFLDDARLATLLAQLAGSDAEVRSPFQVSGQLAAGREARTVEVDDQEIAVPAHASASAWVNGNKPGLLVESADPKPKGTWIWIAGQASRQINNLLRDLDATV